MTPDEMKKLESEQTRGRNAEEIINASIYKEAWDEASKAIASQRRKCGVKDTELAMKLIMAEQTLGIVHSYMENIMRTGKFSEVQLKLEQDRVNWFKRSSGFSRA